MRKNLGGRNGCAGMGIVMGSCVAEETSALLSAHGPLPPPPPVTSWDPGAILLPGGRQPLRVLVRGARSNGFIDQHSAMRSQSSPAAPNVGYLQTQTGRFHRRAISGNQIK